MSLYPIKTIFSSSSNSYSLLFLCFFWDEDLCLVVEYRFLKSLNSRLSTVFLLSRLVLLEVFVCEFDFLAELLFDLDEDEILPSLSEPLI